MQNKIRYPADAVRVIRKHEDAPVLLLLHGFGCTSDDFTAVTALLREHVSLVLPDLPGFGRHTVPDQPGYHSTEYLVAFIRQTAAEYCKDGFFLAGYSMGGRAALQFAVHNTGFLRGLILESTTPGLRDATERMERVRQDGRLISMIEEEGVERFLSFWEALPLFNGLSTLPADRLQSYRRMKQTNTPHGLINSLREFGTGVMPQVWDKLQCVEAPVLLVTGENDLKYNEIAQKMQPLYRSATHHTVKGAGHNVHLEKPEEFVNLVLSFIQNGRK